MSKNWPRETCLTPLEAQLKLAGMPTFGDPVDLGDGFVAIAPQMPAQRTVSIEEFERDMRSAL